MVTNASRRTLVQNKSLSLHDGAFWVVKWKNRIHAILKFRVHCERSWRSVECTSCHSEFDSKSTWHGRGSLPDNERFRAFSASILTRFCLLCLFICLVRFLVRFAWQTRPWTFTSHTHITHYAEQHHKPNCISRVAGFVVARGFIDLLAIYDSFSKHSWERAFSAISWRVSQIESRFLRAFYGHLMRQNRANQSAVNA